MLLDYIDLTQGEKFDKVDAMFESGVVHRDMFSKLFRPNAMVVTIQEGHPRAYLAEKIYVNDRRSALDRQSITLECWTWTSMGASVRTLTASSSLATTQASHGPDHRPLRLAFATGKVQYA